MIRIIFILSVTIIFGFSDNENLQGIAAVLTDFGGFWYNLLFFVMIVLFTYFYTAITVNPNQMADDMKKNGGFIPGIKPGRATSEYLDSVMSKITLPGSLFLGFFIAKGLSSSTEKIVLSGFFSCFTSFSGFIFFLYKIFSQEHFINFIFWCNFFIISNLLTMYFGFWVSRKIT